MTDIKLVRSLPGNCSGCYYWEHKCTHGNPECGYSEIYVEQQCNACTQSDEQHNVISKPKHSHYFKNVSHLEWVDAYRVADLFGVIDPCIQHALKKLLVTGNRGHKDVATDVQDVIDTLERWKEMQLENQEENNFDA